MNEKKCVYDDGGRCEWKDGLSMACIGYNECGRFESAKTFGCSRSAPIAKTDPVIEAIARKLSGINCVPPLEQGKMIKRAAKAGAEALRKQNESEPR